MISKKKKQKVEEIIRTATQKMDILWRNRLEKLKKSSQQKDSAYLSQIRETLKTQQ